MPELPEVQTIVDDLRSAGIVGQKITGSIVLWLPLITGCSVPCFKKMIQGKYIRAISRRGKFIIISLSKGYFLLVHLRMSGHFSLVSADKIKEPHQHIVLVLGGKRELRYRDTRKFGRWHLTRDPSGILKKLGPEPLEKSFKPNRLYLLLQSYRRQLKPFLLDQRLIAGLGNIYADEALWQACLHPRRLSSSLNKSESLALFKAVRCVLRRAIRNKGTSLGSGIGNYKRLNEMSGRNQDRLMIVRNKGSVCPRCGTVITRVLVGQRATYTCAKCQKLCPSRRSEDQKKRS